MVARVAGSLVVLAGLCCGLGCREEEPSVADPAAEAGEGAPAEPGAGLEPGAAATPPGGAEARGQLEPVPPDTLTPPDGAEADQPAGQSAQQSAAQDPQPRRTLAEQLAARRAEFEANATEETKQIYDEGVEEVAASGVLDSALKEGDRALPFALPSATGEIVSLDELLRDGPVVVTWYRGGWCPYCNIQLRVLQERLAEFQELGADVVAISPESPEKAAETKAGNDLEYPVLSDRGNELARAWGVVYTLPEPVQQSFEGQINLEEYNQTDSGELPLAATYVIDRDGTIRYAFVEPDYRVRAEPDEILEVLRQLD